MSLSAGEIPVLSGVEAQFYHSFRNVYIAVHPLVGDVPQIVQTALTLRGAIFLDVYLPSYPRDGNLILLLPDGCPADKVDCLDPPIRKSRFNHSVFYSFLGRTINLFDCQAAMLRARGRQLLKRMPYTHAAMLLIRSGGSESAAEADVRRRIVAGSEYVRAKKWANWPDCSGGKGLAVVSIPPPAPCQQPAIPLQTLAGHRSNITGRSPPARLPPAQLGQARVPINPAAGVALSVFRDALKRQTGQIIPPPRPAAPLQIPPREFVVQTHMAIQSGQITEASARRKLAARKTSLLSLLPIDAHHTPRHNPATPLRQPVIKPEASSSPLLRAVHKRFPVPIATNSRIAPPVSSSVHAQGRSTRSTTPSPSKVRTPILTPPISPTPLPRAPKRRLPELAAEAGPYQRPSGLTPSPAPIGPALTKRRLNDNPAPRAFPAVRPAPMQFPQLVSQPALTGIDGARPPPVQIPQLVPQSAPSSPDAGADSKGILKRVAGWFGGGAWL